MTEFTGTYSDFSVQTSKAQLEKLMFEPKLPQMEWADFIIQKKDNTPIAPLHQLSKLRLGRNWLLHNPKERRKGYGTEATQILVDYLS